MILELKEELVLLERNEEVEVPQRPKRNLDGEGDGVEGERGGDGDGAETLSVDADAFADDARLDAVGAREDGLRLGAGVWYTHASSPAGKTVL
jgi:hypothetical protein